MFGTAGRYAQTIAILAVTAVFAPPVHAAPDVVVSIAPVHSLVAAVMADVGTPKLLVPASASPHTYSLRPSDAQALAAADIVLRVGPDLETFLDKPLDALVAGVVVTLDGAPGITEQEIAADGTDDQGHGDDAHSKDPHIWLSVANARRIAEIAATTLSRQDPANAAAYERNLTRLAGRLDILERDLREMLEPLRRLPYIVMHDAYRHFEAEFGLRRSAAISLSPERRPGARQLFEIRNLLIAADIKCVFAEPQFPEAIAATVVDGTNGRLAQLDPVGVDIPPGPDLYFTLMENLGRALAGCLGG
jgi:zinc transport system substrate-binding protein